MHLGPAAKDSAIRLLEAPGFRDILETGEAAIRKLNREKQ
jgi:hypothetical protein